MRFVPFLLLFFRLFSCEPKIVFQQAQPAGIAALNKIPDRYIGTYRCQSDSSIIIIEPYIAYQQYSYAVTMSIEEIVETENCSLAAGGLYLPGRHQCYPVQYINEDTVVAYVTEIDTLFGFASDQVLKEWKGILMINQKLETEGWLVWTLSPNQDGSLLLDYITLPEEMENFAAVSADYHKETLKKDYERVVINPTPIELHRLLDKPEYHVKCDLFLPINIELERAF